MQSHAQTGLRRPPPLYLLTGLRLLGQKGIRRFALVPLAINIAIFGVLGWWLSSTIGAWIRPDSVAGSEAWYAAAFSLVRNLIAWVATIVVWVALAWVYTFVANIIAAPFNGLLAERVEAHLTGKPLPPGSGFGALVKEIPRTLTSEATRLWYLASRFIVVFIALFMLGFVPLLGLLAPALMFLFGAWVFALEYLDYPMGNHGMRFRDVRRRAAEKRLSCLGFGAAVALTSSIPIINLVVMPAAVAGATALWVDRWAPDPIS